MVSAMAEIKLPDNYSEIAVMTAEPLKGCTPDQIRDLMKRYQSDEAIAAFYAGVSNKTGWIGHDIGEPENDEETNERIKRNHAEWWALEKEIFSEIVRRLERDNLKKGASYVTSGKPMHYIIKPFMERNGFRDGAGWWIDEYDK